jgi:DNA invertase Pin-like site-specific DNA recombinase
VNPKKPRVALYARVSTNDQKADLQLDGLRKMAEQRGWTVAGEYVDLGVSGSKDRRPQLDAMLKDGHRGKHKVWAVWKLDRLARSVRHLVLLADELRALGIDLVSVEDTIDTTTPSGRFVFHVLGAVAELERELIRERTIAGLQAAKRRGVRLGRRRVRFDLEKAVALRGDGLSYDRVAAVLGVSVGTIHAALKRLQLSSSAEAHAGT